jgi:uncharacterized protein
MELYERSFLGRGWSFPPEFDESLQGVLLSAEEQDIRESLRIILSTIPGERLMVPDFGCGLHKLVFENLDVSMITYLQDLIATSILHYEARISVNQVVVDGRELIEGIVYVMIDYTIRGTNTRNNMVYPFYINEGTHLRSEDK